MNRRLEFFSLVRFALGASILCAGVTRSLADMGAGANVNAFFAITTMIIAVPTGVKVFNWLFTMTI